VEDINIALIPLKDYYSERVKYKKIQILLMISNSRLHTRPKKIRDDKEILKLNSKNLMLYGHVSGNTFFLS